MSGKTGKGKLPVRASTRRTQNTGYAAETLSQVNLIRARAIATQYSVVNPEKFELKDLLPKIRERMLLVKQCAECSNAQCLPESHVFPAVNPYAELDEDGNPIVRPQENEGPDAQALAALNLASNLDRVVQRAQDAPSFLDSLPGGPAPQQPGSDPPALALGGPPTLEDIGPEMSPSGSQHHHNSESLFDSFNARINDSNNSVFGNEGDDQSEDSDAEDNEDEEAFQAQIRALKEKNETRLNTHRNSLASKASEEAKKHQRQQDKIKKQQEKQAHRQKILDDIEAQFQASLRDVEAEVQQQQQDLQADLGSSRSRASRTSKKRSVSIADSPTTPRSKSVRPTTSPRGVDLADLVEIMDRQQSMMNKQHERTLGLVTTALKGMASSQRVPVANIENFGGCSSSSDVDKSGRSQVIPAGNPDAAREHGFHPPINWGLTGSMDNIDLNKIKKSMQSGKNRTGADGIVIRQHYWPHDCLSKASRHILGRNVKVKHGNQTQTMFTEGFLQKLLIDTPKASMDPILCNKIKFFAMLTKLSYTLPWQDILSIAEDFFESYEYDHISWDSWPVVEQFVKDSYEQIKLSSFSRPRSNSAPAGSGAGFAGNFQKKPLPEDANGVPLSYMRKQFICCKFNLESCEVQAGGDHKAGNATLHHWCGGCFKQSNGATKAAHTATSCTKGPFARLFA